MRGLWIRFRSRKASRRNPFGRRFSFERYDRMVPARPIPVIVAIVIVGIPAGIAILTGSYSLIRSPPEIPLAMIALSFIIGLVLMAGLNAMWERRYGGWPLSVGAMVFGLVLSAIAQLVIWPGAPSAIGVSWIVTLVSAIGLVILSLPVVRAYYKDKPSLPASSPRLP